MKFKMADLQENSKIDMQSSYSVGTNSDPKNMQELTQYVQSLLQQMQDRFQAMSDQVINRKLGNLKVESSQNLFLQSALPQAAVLLVVSVPEFNDEMGNRIDDLEKNIADLMIQAGVEGPEK